MARRYGYGRSYYGGGYGFSRWAPYVPVAQRRANAMRSAKSLEKSLGRALAPVAIEGRTIASSFWGRAWCDNMEAYSDFANRLPRGRTYVRNGSVIDLHIAAGEITALVSGSDIYSIKLTISKLPPAEWKAIQRDCARSISSLIDLLQGRFDKGVMQRLSQPKGGLFPKPNQIKMQCSCPDYAGLCKHIAAVLYGVGARLDAAPELLFTLRNVNHLDLIGQAVTADNLDRALAADTGETLDSGDLGAMFGIELDSSAASQTAADGDLTTKPARRRRATAEPAAPPRPPKKSPRKRTSPVQPVAVKATRTKKRIAVAAARAPASSQRSKGRPPAAAKRLRAAK